MKIRFRSEDLQELHFEREYSSGYGVDASAGIQEVKSTFTYKGVNANTHRIYIPGVIVSMFEGASDDGHVYAIDSDFPNLQMHFELSTSGCQYIPRAQHEPETLVYKGEHSLLFYPSLNGNLHYLPRPDSFSVEIEVSLEFLNRIFNNDLGMLKEFGLCIEKSQPVIMGNRSYPITPQMKEVLFEIRYCEYAGALKKIFVEAKVMELLTLQIDQINRDHKAPRDTFKKQDIDKLHYVRDVMLSNLATPYSIEQLCKLAGLNRTRLQEGFKKTFGLTVFAYLTKIRMEYARKIILSGNYNTIADVAAIAGYKNPQHFTASFKKMFHYLPSDLKK